MILKHYQKQIIEDLKRYIDILKEKRNLAEAFNEFWIKHPTTSIQPTFGQAVEPYKNNVPGIPHVCIKVPTAGGKTFIAANALATLFSTFSPSRPKIAVWLVPSNSILEQTIRNFRNPRHPYREQLNADFSNRVVVFDKKMLLQGADFNTTTIRENMTLCILSFDSLRANNKDDRKVYEDNGNLQSFAKDVGTDEISVMSVLQAFSPVVIVDESHNAESELSVEMLHNLNPSFVLDLTATPRKNSNIISFTSAIELKKENMVKLPVIVYNHHSKEEVVASALELRSHLEYAANVASIAGAPYIRPIVLFQAEPKNQKDTETFEKVKSKLLELKIPEEQIKIKTATINELQNIDLMSKDCPVRYIITVNALKEGWDCPFAYILASLADRSSAVDVEQILGRVLRLPNVHKNENAMLNMSYVFTASAKFSATLDNIVKGLNKAGFSRNDYKQIESITENSPKMQNQPDKEEPSAIVFDTTKIFWKADSDNAPFDNKAFDAETTPSNPIVKKIEEQSQKENDDMESALNKADKEPIVPKELENQVNSFYIKDTYKESAEQVALPQFFLNMVVEGKNIDLFNINSTPFERKFLLKNFSLKKADTDIDFENVEIEMRSIDLDESKRDFTPLVSNIEKQRQEEIINWDSNIKDMERKRQKCAELLRDWIGTMYPIPDRDIVDYIQRVISDFDERMLNSMLNTQSSYAVRIKQKIKNLTEIHYEENFIELFNKNKIVIRNTYKLPNKIKLSKNLKPLPRSLYEEEDSVNAFEETVINAVANMENIEFWTRNREKKDFCINGFINHYPDFIIKTKNGLIIALETKGDHLDAEKKIKLGNLWQNAAGRDNYRYFLVYENRKVNGAFTKDEFIDILKNL